MLCFFPHKADFLSPIILCSLSIIFLFLVYIPKKAQTRPSWRVCPGSRFLVLFRLKFPSPPKKLHSFFSPRFHIVLHCFSASSTWREHCPGSAVTHHPRNCVFQPLLTLILCVSLCGCCFSPSHTCLIGYTCTKTENLGRASNLLLLLLLFFLLEAHKMCLSA